ncbi:MAG TPA: hypothetical protein PLG23_11500 [Thermoflexales bacterium]|jgi:hypothetical protein|nr:hypothetical protein [Thermoflexales bacterium]
MNDEFSLSAAALGRAERAAARFNPAGVRGQFPERKSVTRVDTRSGPRHGWQVRVRWRGVTESRYFPDARAGMLEGWLAARRWRDAAEARLGKVRTERRVRPPAKGRRETGIRDIIVRTRARDGRPVARRIIEVSWNPTPDKTMRATFSVERLGLREAMRQARATRREKEIEIYGAPLKAKRSR